MICKCVTLICCGFNNIICYNNIQWPVNVLVDDWKDRLGELFGVSRQPFRVTVCCQQQCSAYQHHLHHSSLGLRWRPRPAQWCHLVNDDEAYSGDQGQLRGVTWWMTMRLTVSTKASLEVCSLKLLYVDLG